MRATVILKFVVIGILVGILSWAVCPLVSDRIEPFDTGLGFIIGQSMMFIAMIYAGYSTRSFLLVMLAVIGIYLGQVGYSYFAVGSEWIVLGMITIITLCVIPLLGGIIGWAAGRLVDWRARKNAA